METFKMCVLQIKQWLNIDSIFFSFLVLTIVYVTNFCRDHGDVD